MKTALRTTISLLLVSWLALTFLPARSAQAAEEDASIPPDLLLAALDATSRPPVAGSRTGGLSFTFEAGGLQAAGLDWGVALSKLGREDQVRALGATPRQSLWAILAEARIGVLVSVIAGFGSIISEVGAVMLVGGNIEHRTRVLTTAIVLETGKGNFDLALALGVILLTISFLINLLMLYLQGKQINA